MTRQDEALAARDGQGRWLSVREAAARAGVAEGTWRSYVKRGYVPPHGRRNPGTGRPEWLESAVDAYLEARPGAGARTDLKAQGG